MTGIIGSNIFLSVIEESHLEIIFTWKNDLELLSLIMAHPILSGKEDVSNWLKKNSSDPNQVLLGIYNKEFNLIGIVRLMFIDWISKTTELGIYIGSYENKAKGLGSEAMTLIIKHAFENLNLRKVILRVLDSNAKAKHVYTKLGFEQEGLLRKQFWVNGRYEDVCLMGLIKA